MLYLCCWTWLYTIVMSNTDQEKPRLIYTCWVFLSNCVFLHPYASKSNLTSVHFSRFQEIPQHDRWSTILIHIFCNKTLKLMIVIMHLNTHRKFSDDFPKKSMLRTEHSNIWKFCWSLAKWNKFLYVSIDCPSCK